MATTISQQPVLAQSNVQAAMQQQAQQQQTNDTSAKNPEEQSGEATSLTTYVFIGFLIATLLVLSYYAYAKFVENSNCSSEAFIEGNRQERDDPVMDFNLRAAIQDLENKQRAVLKKLSSDTGM
jgi:hypothetical protein